MNRSEFDDWVTKERCAKIIRQDDANDVSIMLIVKACTQCSCRWDTFMNPYEYGEQVLDLLRSQIEAVDCGHSCA